MYIFVLSFQNILCVELKPKTTNSPTSHSFIVHISAIFPLPRVYGRRCMNITLLHCVILARSARHIISDDLSDVEACQHLKTFHPWMTGFFFVLLQKPSGDDHLKIWK
jgi:hypothetical protein